MVLWLPSRSKRFGDVDRIGRKSAGAHVVRCAKASCLVVIFWLLSFVILKFVHSSSPNCSIYQNLSLCHVRSSFGGFALEEEVRSRRTKRIGLRWNKIRTQGRK